MSSQVLSYFKVPDTTEDHPIATSRGPNNTLLATYDHSISIYAQLPTNEGITQQPVQTFSLAQSIKRLRRKQQKIAQKDPLATLPSLPDVERFTAEALYDAQSEQFIVVTDGTHLLTFPSAVGASVFDGQHWRVFDEKFSEETATHIHSIYLHPTLPTHLLIVDNWARVHSYPIPKATATHVLLSNKTNTPTTTWNRLLNNIANNTAPIIHWAGLVTAEHLIVATQFGMVCYNINTTTIADEVTYVYAQQHAQPALTTTNTTSTTTTAKGKKKKAASTTSPQVSHQQRTKQAIALLTDSQSAAPQIANVSSFRKDTERPPRFFATSITQSVLYTDGHLEIYHFNLASNRFSLVYARTLSRPYTLPSSRVQVLTPQHIAILTPSNLAVSDVNEQDIKYFIIDLTYYTISTYQAIKKTLPTPRNLYPNALTQPTTSNSKRLTSLVDPAAAIVAKPQHAFQIDLSGLRTIVTSTYIINNEIHVLVTKPTLPTLALSIGSATRDAPFWSSISTVNTKSSTQLFDAAADSTSLQQQEDKQQQQKKQQEEKKQQDKKQQEEKQETIAKKDEKTTKKPSTLYIQFIDTVGTYISLIQPACAVPVREEGTQTNVEVEKTTTLKGGKKTDADAKDVILTLSSQTLPMLNPFSSEPLMQSLSNRIDRVKPPSTLLMQTKTAATSSLDTIILQHWSKYLLQCDNMERNSLMKMLPRLIPHLTQANPSNKAQHNNNNNDNTTDNTQTMNDEEQPQPQQQQQTPRGPQKRPRGTPSDVDGDASGLLPTQSLHLANSTTTTTPGNHLNLTELSADVFLYEFFSYCTSYALDLPTIGQTVQTLPLPNDAVIENTFQLGPNGLTQHTNSHYNIPDALKHHPHCACHVNTGFIPPAVRKDKDEGKDNQQQLQTFTTQLVFQPCAWKALLGSTMSLTNSKTSYHTLKSILFHNASLFNHLSQVVQTQYQQNKAKGAHVPPQQHKQQQDKKNNADKKDGNGGVVDEVVDPVQTALHHAPVLSPYLQQAKEIDLTAFLYDTLNNPIQPFCNKSNKIVLTKPLSPLFNQLLFRECLRKVDSICCTNCPNILYLVPLEVLIANCMLNSSLAVTCVKIGLKHKLWSLISSIVTASNLSHSESFIDIIMAILDHLSENFGNSEDSDVSQVYSIALVEDDVEKPKDEKTPAKKQEKKQDKTGSAKPKKAIPSVEEIQVKKNHHSNIPRPPSTVPGHGPHQHRQLHDLTGFCTRKQCTCNASTTPPLFTTRPAPSGFHQNYPYVSQFVAATIPQQSASCVLFTLLSSPITSDILIQQLRCLPLDYVLLLLNILSLLFQATLGQVPLPQWLSPCGGDCHRYLTAESLLKWIVVLIDGHAKELMISQHLLHSTQYHALNVFASLHSLIHAYCTGNAELLESVMSTTEQLTILRELGMTKLNVTDPYSISIVKF